MKASRFTEEQIIGILGEHEAGAKTADVSRKHSISSAPFYKWKERFGGLKVSDAKRLRVFEDENEAQEASRGGDAGQRELKEIAAKKR